MASQIKLKPQEQGRLLHAVQAEVGLGVPHTLCIAMPVSVIPGSRQPRVPLAKGLRAPEIIGRTWGLRAALSCDVTISSTNT